MMGYEELKQIAIKSGKVDEPEFVSKVNKKMKALGISQGGAAMMVMNEFKLNTTFDKETTPVVIKKILELKDGDDYVEIVGTIISAEFKFYDVCSACGKSIEKTGGVCKTHGKISNPSRSFLYKTRLDDGTGVLNTTMFVKQVERLFDMKEDDICELEKDMLALGEMNTNALGRQVVLRGKYEYSEQYQGQFTAKLIITDPAEIAKRKGVPVAGEESTAIEMDDIYDDTDTI